MINRMTAINIEYELTIANKAAKAAGNILLNQTVNAMQILISLFISMLYFCFGVMVFYVSYDGAKKKGTLINIGE